MLKMYQAQQSGPGNAPEFWEATWEQGQLAQALFDPRVVENDPVYQLIAETLRQGRVFLEGGCGQAQFVKYFAERGYRAVGIDFASQTVEKVLRLAPSLDVRVGNILDLPFADGEVHTYYSGGVVEHFETGPEPSLREARRVLAPDGWFLCSVPDESSLRRRLFRADYTERRELDPGLIVRRVERTREEPPPGGYEFFQYAFTEREFTGLLEAAGFVVERAFGYGLSWGLMELPGFQALYGQAFALAKALRSRLQRGGAPATGAAAALSVDGSGGGGSRGGVGGLLRRVLVKEDPSTPGFGPLLRLLCEHCANMRMFVARPRG